MKKGQILEGILEQVDFPNKGTVHTEEGKVTVKNAIPGQRVRFMINKKRGSRAEGRLLEVLEPSPLEVRGPQCSIFPACGGCIYQTMDYQEQLKMKEAQVKKLLDEAIAGAGQVKSGITGPADQVKGGIAGAADEVKGGITGAADEVKGGIAGAADQPHAEKGEMYGITGNEKIGEPDYIFEGIRHSPKEFTYRNKMEFSFGDACKDGELELGLHKKGSTYDVLTAHDCKLVHRDMNVVLNCVLQYFRARGTSYYHKMSHEGYLRHLLLRRAETTGEILVNLVTTSQQECDLMQLVTALRNLEVSGQLEGKIVGILHIINDSLADVVRSDETRILYGQDYFYETILGLRFKITPFSFFQTNSLGAEVLYSAAREYIGDTKDMTVFDLYSGTGTIAQILASVAKEVIGVEIVEEAVEAAKENAALNGLENCHFLAGDVLKVLDEIAEKPDFIVLDPPRDGIHPKALPKIIGYGVQRMVYISCKPTSLARDLDVLIKSGYRVERVCCVDMFPQTVHVETVVGLQRKDT